MVNQKKFTEELNEVFNYIINILIKKYPTDNISVPYFILSALENEESIAYKALSKVMLVDNIDNLKETYYERMEQTKTDVTTPVKFDGVFDTYVDDSYNIDKSNKTNSGNLLYTILVRDESTFQDFKHFGLSLKQIQESINAETASLSDNIVDKPIKHEKKKTNKKDITTTLSVIKQIKSNPNNDVERNLINLNTLAENDKIDTFYGANDKYDTLFTLLNRRRNNNIVVTGKQGVGKTTFVEHIANLITENAVPEPFKDKILMKFDFISLISGTMYKGAFESKFKGIVEEAKKSGNYIFFIDDIHTLINNNRMAETDIESLLNLILDDKNIQLISTSSDNGYSNILSSYPSIGRKIQKLELLEPTVDESLGILTYLSPHYEDFHSVHYTEEVLKECINLSKRYVTEHNLPVSAIDVMDETGARIALRTQSNDNIKDLQKQLEALQENIERMRGNSSTQDYNLLDEEIKKEIRLKSKISILKKHYNLSKHKEEITVDNIRETIARKTNIPLQELSLTEKEKLKNINEEIKKIVIGQDEAVDEVCKVIKRQRIGLSNPSKPSVLFFGGYTGTGKTYLAKTIAAKIFGDEKYLVRLDMSEYSDKTSTNKLIGSSSGYVGYERGGILTEEIKKKKYCVLLLDEIEKANEEVHNMFLQMFDDGQMTDNKGNIVDFKNVIVIMTSNVGAAEVSYRGNGIGFITDSEQLSKSIISKELKKSFKPEFINRIDKIIYFNKLNEINLRNIIKIEIKKVEEKLKAIGYGMDETLTETDMVDKIYNSIKDKSEYGARPVIREVQTQIEDKITDIIIDGDLEQGHIFSINQIT